jgi:hypothetical protein
VGACLFVYVCICVCVCVCSEWEENMAENMVKMCGVMCGAMDVCVCVLHHLQLQLHRLIDEKF